MGVGSSKDESSKIVLGALPPGFLDYRGRDLRDKLDACLERNMWFFSIGGLLITVPICMKYKTERPLMAAAITCPLLDMMFGTIRCDKEKEEFRAYYRQLLATWNEQAGRHEAPGAKGSAAAVEPAVTPPVLPAQQALEEQQQQQQQQQQQLPRQSYWFKR